MSAAYEQLERQPRHLADHTAAWERLQRLEDVNGTTRERIERFAAGKRITFEALAALGTRVAVRRSGQVELAFAGDNGRGTIVAIKYRPLDGSSHDSYAEKPSTWLRPIIVGNRGATDWLLAEGETDAARLLQLVGDAAQVMALPAGALTFRPEWAALIPSSATVALCHDADDDGDTGADKAARLIRANTRRLRPPIEGADWCEWDGDRAEFLELVKQAEPGGASPFDGLTHAEVLELELPHERFLVADLVPRGALGMIAGLPETHKSWLAHAIAVGVARGDGEILGCKIADSGAVGYFWQDDAKREEAERVKLYERVHATPDPSALPLTWFLNEGLELPRDLPRLRATIEDRKLVLVVLDSFYNVAVGDLKDRDAGVIFAALKSEIADVTDCTVLIVDHMAWPSDAKERARLRSYGDVYKAAAARFGIYIDVRGESLRVEARGNNMRGFKPTHAEWDAAALALRLLETDPDGRDIEAEIAAWLPEHPRSSTNAIAKGIEAGKKRVADVLKASDRFVFEVGPNRAHLWVPSDAQNHSGNLFEQEASVGSLVGSPSGGREPQGEPEPVVPSDDETPEDAGPRDVEDPWELAPLAPDVVGWEAA